MKALRNTCPCIPHEQSHLKQQRYVDLSAVLPNAYDRSVRHTAPKKGARNTQHRRPALRAHIPESLHLQLGKTAPVYPLHTPAVPCHSFRQRFLPSKGTDFHATQVQTFGQGNHSGLRHVLPSSHRPSGKSFWKGGVRGGRTFFQKGFPQICRRLPAFPNKKIPGGAGIKKDPLAL